MTLRFLGLVLPSLAFATALASFDCGAATSLTDGNPPPDACVPTTCAAAGRSCGALPDGCGASLDCGVCGPLVPADPDATPAARSVLIYLAGLADRPDKRVLSGARVHTLATEWDAIQQRTGFTPAIMGDAYLCWRAQGCAGKPGLSFPLQQVIDHWNQGGLVQMTEGVGNPKGGGCSLTADAGADTEFDSADFDKVLTPGDPYNVAFLSQLDVIAAGYQTLSDAGVVVLVHLLNEMNGNWLWWSGGTPDQYKALFRMEFDYYTKTKGLHNLLFTYAPNAGNGNYAAYYPGDAYIDVAGLDYYLDVDGPIPKADGYDQITTVVAPTKPFAFIEFGPFDGLATVFTPRDYSQLIAGIKQSMPKVCYWHAWNQVFSMGIADPATGQSHLNVGELLSDPWVVNLGDVALPPASP